MREKHILRLVFTALMLALSCVLTMVVQIPTPMNGYVNLGDCAVILSGWILGPGWGAAAGGIGSALADLITGYACYAPGTAVIKGLTAAIAFLITKTAGKNTFRGRILAALISECWMVIGYFLYACLILGKGLPAAASIPGNLIQGAVGAVAATAVMTALGKNRFSREMIKKLGD